MSSIKKRVFRSNEELRSEALKYNTRKDFKNQSRDHYNAASKRGIIKDICSHMTYLCNRPYTFEEIKKEALKYNSRSELEKNNSGVYSRANKMGILDIVCSHMTPIRKRWIDSDIFNEALKFKSRSEFQRGNLAAYAAAKRKNILDRACAHMEAVVLSGKNHPRFKWSDEILQKEALKYSSPGEFQKYNDNAYQAACRRGAEFMRIACSHMKGLSGTSLMEKELFCNIKKHYPNATKLRDRKVKISEKPFIKGFDIDIFIPELKKGIEFDGKLHHSFEYMRKDKFKIKWSDEDIRNYHDIKNGWFLTKGVKILHIKEKEWNKSKENCIKRCLEFLGDSYVL